MSLERLQAESRGAYAFVPIPVAGDLSVNQAPMWLSEAANVPPQREIDLAQQPELITYESLSSEQIIAAAEELNGEMLVGLGAGGTNITMGNAEAMCPIPPEQRTPLDNALFKIKLANGFGLEVPAEQAPVMDAVLRHKNITNKLQAIEPGSEKETQFRQRQQDWLKTRGKDAALTREPERVTPKEAKEPLHDKKVVSTKELKKPQYSEVHGSSEDAKKADKPSHKPVPTGNSRGVAATETLVPAEPSKLPRQAAQRDASAAKAIGDASESLRINLTTAPKAQEEIRHQAERSQSKSEAQTHTGMDELPVKIEKPAIEQPKRIFDQERTAEERPVDVLVAVAHNEAPTPRPLAQEPQPLPAIRQKPVMPKRKKALVLLGPAESEGQPMVRVPEGVVPHGKDEVAYDGELEDVQWRPVDSELLPQEAVFIEPTQELLGDEAEGEDQLLANIENGAVRPSAYIQDAAYEVDAWPLRPTGDLSPEQTIDDAAYAERVVFSPVAAVLKNVRYRALPDEVRLESYGISEDIEEPELIRLTPDFLTDQLLGGQETATIYPENTDPVSASELTILQLDTALECIEDVQLRQEGVMAVTVMREVSAEIQKDVALFVGIVQETYTEETIPSQLSFMMTDDVERTPLGSAEVVQRMIELDPTSLPEEIKELRRLLTEKVSVLRTALQQFSELFTVAYDPVNHELRVQTATNSTAHAYDPMRERLGALVIGSDVQRAFTKDLREMIARMAMRQSDFSLAA